MYYCYLLLFIIIITISICLCLRVLAWYPGSRPVYMLNISSMFLGAVIILKSQVKEGHLSEKTGCTPSCEAPALQLAQWSVMRVTMSFIPCYSWNSYPKNRGWADTFSVLDFFKATPGHGQPRSILGQLLCCHLADTQKKSWFLLLDKITSLRVIPTVTSYWNIFVTNSDILCAKIWRGREGEDNSDEI